MQYAMLVLSSLLLAVDFCLGKLYQVKRGTSMRAGLGFNALLGLFTAVAFFAANGFTLKISAYSLIMSAVISCFIMAYSLLGFRLMKVGSIGHYSLFLMTGGMIVPYVYGVLFLDEPFSLLRTAALVLVLAGVILSNFSGDRINPRHLAMYIAVFLLNGALSVGSKLHQIETAYDTVNTTEFLVYVGIFKFLIAGALYLFARRSDAPAPDSGGWRAPLLIILASTAMGGLSYLLQLLGAQSLPASVLYPFCTGGTIILTTIAGWLVFRDKLSRRLIISVILCFIGTVMFL